MWRTDPTHTRILLCYEIQSTTNSTVQTVNKYSVEENKYIRKTELTAVNLKTKLTY